MAVRLTRLLLVACLMCLTRASPLHFVIMPNSIRLETEETMTLTALGATSDVTYSVYLQDEPDRKKTFSEYNVTVPQGEVMNVTVKMGVADIPESPPTPLIVSLVVETIDHTPHFKKETKLLVNESPGYIFIQTDKPLYTPDQSVMTRVVALDEQFRPVNWPMQVDILNPEGMTITRQQVEQKDLMVKDSMKIPENPVYGNWSVTAKFTNGLKTVSSVRFEVKEYVLPTFGVNFQHPPEGRVILPNDTHFTTAVEARYMYGKPVKGHVTVTLGLLWHGHVFTVGKQRGLPLNKTGFAECRISMEELQLPIQSVWFPNGGKLHLQADVTEAASGRVERADDVSVVFSDHLYAIKFSRSSRFFKPGLNYVLEIDVHKANGELGSDLDLDIECLVGQKADTLTALPALDWPKNRPFVTDARGKLGVEFLVPPDAKTLQFKVSPSLSPDDQVSSYRFLARPFYSPSAVYMQARAVLSSGAKRGSVPEVGDYVTLTTRYTAADDVDEVNIVVVSRGQIVWQARTLNILGSSTSFHFKLTQAMSPGARILAFAVRGQEVGSEVISDSVWMDVKGRCEGEISMQREERGRTVLRPGEIGTITLHGPPSTVVGLVAVDNAVYQLKNNTLTRQSVFAKMLSHDRGCGCGSGKDTGKVFENAGLSVLTNAGLEVPVKLVEGCLDKMVRRKRKAKKGRREMMAVCCLEGAKVQNATLPLCYHISQQLKMTLGPGLCVREFYSCCRDTALGQFNWAKRARLQTLEDREPEEMEISLTDDGEVTKMADIPLRTNFPESWWFEEHVIGPDGKTEVNFALPDSITTWSVQAVGVSKEAGLCVAPPLQLATFSSFFIHLDLPYSVIRLEQLEVRATVYNYMSRRLRVNLVLQSVDGVCYSGQPGKSTEMVKLEIEANDAGSAYFPIVPLEIGEFPIRVMAFSSWGRDGVEKTLRVEGEGIETIHTISVMLDPSGKRFLRSRSSNHSFSVKNEVRVAEKRQSVELDLDLPQDVIPDTDSCTVHAMGDLMGPTLQVLVEGVTELLRLPTGCGEQNLIYLAPNVYVTRYLRATRKLTSAVEKKSRTLIRQGVARQMTFRKSDGSYGTWPHADASTWLTAFAMKTLCQAEHYVAIEHNQTCASVEWIAQQQNTDGSFKEKAWVTHREMLGGINGDVSHAAYILIALMECDCPGKVQKEVIVKTMRFIQTRVALTDRPLALATSAYALTLAGSRISEVVVKRLMMLAKSSPEGFTYWAPGTDEDFKDHDKPYWFAKKPGALAVEVTSYALLTLLVRGDIKTGTSIVGWLTQQRNSHGAFISTQDTVVGLQALSEYSIKSYSAILDMTCHISSEVDDRFRKSISLTPEDAMVLKSVPKVPTGGKLHFEAEGTGVGLMQVEVRFNVPNDLDQCRFDVKVNTHRPNTLIQSFFGESRSKCEPCDLECEEDDYDDIDGDEGDDDDFENFTFPPIVPRIQTLWYKRKSGAGSATPRPSKKQGPGVEDNMSSAQTPRIPFGSKMGRPRSRRSVKPYSDVVVCIQVCARFLGVKTTGMSVMDVGLFTGFVPIEEDLKALKEKGSIDHYEKSKRSVVLYIDEISNTQSSCVRFRARQEHMAENIQPAKVQVFDYYNPDDRCTVFYKSDNRSGQLANFCDKQKQICQCLESRCAYCEESWSGLRWMDMMRFACKNATYVLEIKALDRDLEKAGFERILGQISDTSVQRGPHKLQVGDKVILLKRASCFCPRVSPGKSYLMMLDAPKRFRDSDGNQIYAFLLDKTIFALENFKVKQKGLTSAQRSTAKSVRRTVRRLKRRGCSRVKHRKKNRRGKGRGKKSERANTRRS